MSAEPDHVVPEHHFCVKCFSEVAIVDGYWQCDCFRVGSYELDRDYHQKPAFWMYVSNSPEDAARNRQWGRLLRLAVIKNLLGQHILDRAEALELLDGNLSPDDPSSYCDDRNLIDLSFEEAQNATKPANPA